VTTGTRTHSESAPRISPIDHEAAMRFAATEYERGAALLAQLEPAQWATPTVNTGWDVRATVGHMVGMMEMVSSFRHLISQQVAAQRAARRASAPVTIDELTALQVRRNAGLTTSELLAKYRELAPKAVRGRRRMPAVMRRRAMPERQLIGGQFEAWTFGFLFDVILTRDPFMHRLDIHAATGLPPQVTAEHEGRIVDLIVREWAERHGKPYALELTGPAGGRWTSGDGESIRLEAMDFCRVLSGRAAVSTKVEVAGLLDTAVPF
jgi:uncharacterized protein (TIGR03083 family)